MLSHATIQSQMKADEVMPNHPVYSDDMREIVESFVVETQEIFDDLNNDLLRLEHAEDTLPVIDKIFRAVHTVKGTAGFLSLDQLNLLSHRFEDVLNRLRRREVTFHPGMMDLMFAAFDMMNVLLQQVLDSAIEPIPMDGLLDDLQRLATEGFADSYDLEHTPPLSGGDGEQRAAQISTSRAPADIDEEEASMSTAEESARRGRGTDSVRVSVERLDELLNLVGELVVNRNRLARILADSDSSGQAFARLADVTAISSQLEITTSRLQSAVLQTRMVPVGRVFSRFHRVVRELGKELDKEVELVIEGSDTELDKSIVDAIGDPLLHLIRNAVDHGIESTSERKQRGKPACGRLFLRGEHDGSHILVTLEDDGKGIDVDTLRRRAVRRGFADEHETAAMSAGDVVDLIFKPGFTTNDLATRISGRGMGLDVVKTEISRLGGEVRIHSDLGRGTRFTLRLPLTLAVMQCLLVESGAETYALPLNRVTEVVAVKDVFTVRGRPVIRLRDEIVRLVDIADTFDLPTTSRRNRYAVVVRRDDERFGLVVDRLRGHEELVVKPLNAYLSSIEGFSGSTFLGDGRVVMVLDVNEVIRLELAQRSPESLRIVAASA